MDPVLPLLLGSAAAAAGGLAYYEVRERRRAEATWVVHDVRFPSSVTSEGVHAVIAGVSGLRRTTVVFEVVASHQEIRHRIAGPQSAIETLRGAIGAHIPGARLSSAEPNDPSYLRSSVW